MHYFITVYNGMHKIKGRNSTYIVFVAKFIKIKIVKIKTWSPAMHTNTRNPWRMVRGTFIIIYLLEMEGNNDKKDSDV